MKIIYEAKDGKQFEEERECAQYEFGLSYADILPFFANDDIRVWDNSHKKVIFGEFSARRDLELFFDNIFYIEFKTEKARSALEEFADKNDIGFDLSYGFPFNSADFYYWDEQHDCWSSFSTLKGLVASLEEIRNSPSN